MTTLNPGDDPAAWIDVWVLVFTAVAALIAAFSFIWAVRQFRKEWARLEDARQEAAFDTVNSHYFDFLELCMQHPELELADLSGSADPYSPPANTARDFSVRNQVLYEYFFQLLEKVFVLYRVGTSWTPEFPPSGHTKVSSSSTREGNEVPAFAVGEDQKPASELGDFRKRQWEGWDFWISEYCKRPSIRSHFETLDNDKTYDSEFMRYMQCRMEQAEELSRRTL